MDVHIPTTGTHPSLGMKFVPTQHAERIQLMDIDKSTPAAKLP
jgi:hypothetical protein